MKNLVFTLVGILITISIWAQAPKSFNYQAVLRDNAGEIIANEAIEVTISILFGSADGSPVYTEIHNTQTNAYGLINLQIGEGNSSDELSSVNWENPPFFVQISIDGTLFGTSQLLSVPYALYAEKAGNSFSGSFNDLTEVPEFPDLSNVFSGNFNDLTNIPENLDTNTTDDFSGDYNDLTNKPNIPEGAEQVFSENEEVAFITDKKVGIGTQAARGKMEVLDGGVLFAGETGSVEISGPGTRLMWIPEKAAFRAGKVDGEQWDMDSIGVSSTALGGSTIASGNTSIATGGQTVASGPASTAMGFKANASGDVSTAMGNNTKAIGNSSTAMGFLTEASGLRSTSMGNNTKASGNFSIAMGLETEASGVNATAMGEGTQASGENATAMGFQTKATESASIAMGSQTEASNIIATSMGFKTKASGDVSTAMGNNTQAIGNASTAMGFFTEASGLRSTAIGNNTKAIGNFSIAMGVQAEASGESSTAIGVFSEASKRSSVAIGSLAKADHEGSVVISANSNQSVDDIISSADQEQIVMRADGGFYFSDKKVDPLQTINGVKAFINTSTGAWLSATGAWGNSSDRNLKENFELLDGESMIEKIKALEVTTWNYKKDGKGISHIGPMAQDFYRIYGLGSNDISISTVDGIGVALATIKALIEKNEKLETRLAALEKKLEILLSTTQINVNSKGE